MQLIVWHCVLGIAPTYLLELFILTSACSDQLCSASIGDLLVPHARMAIKQHGAFSIVGPSTWNSLPSELHSLPRDLSGSFYKLLKTYFCPGLGWECLGVVTFKWRYINSLDS